MVRGITVHALALLLGTLSPAFARAATELAPQHLALVIGNANYVALPKLPGCLHAADTVKAALHGRGFTVVAANDATSGSMEAAIGDFARRLAAAPGASAVVYVCGYGIGFNNRIFLLPVSAHVAVPSDVLTEGILTKSLFDTLTRSQSGAAVVALDVMPTPGMADALELGSLARMKMSNDVGFVAAADTQPPNASTALAAALASNLHQGVVAAVPFVTRLRQQISTAGTVAVAMPPMDAGFLIAPPPPIPQPKPIVAAEPVPIPVTAAQVANNAPAFPAEADLTDIQRRRIQAALASLGYYDGRVDGVFGTETRAAIRRFQHEIGTDMTGTITPAEAARLVAAP